MHRLTTKLANLILSAAFIFLCFGSLAPNVCQGQLPKTDLKCGINFGNMLEAPFEGAWGLSAEERFFDLTKSIGIDFIRLPVSWTHHAAQEAPYQIENEFFERIDWCLEQARQRKLKVVLNNHHYDELNTDPAAETPRALALWKQIATRYADRNEDLYFEIHNEPHGAFNENPELWNTYMAQALAVIRESNPTRKVLVGPVFWNNIEGLDSFTPPKDDNLIATFHYYAPFDFTHQGAEWISPERPTGRRWLAAEVDFDSNVQNWSWSTEVIPQSGSVQINYTEGWAGFYAHLDTGVKDADWLIFTADRAVSLYVEVTDAEGNRHGQAFETEDQQRPYMLDFRGSDISAPITDVVIQSNTPQPGQTFNCSRVFLRTNNGLSDVLVSRARKINTDFTRMQKWAITNNLPVLLGEFGSYRFGIFRDRASYTRTVRRTADQLGFAWAYWELAAGFGIYDPEAERFRKGLLRALIPLQRQQKTADRSVSVSP